MIPIQADPWKHVVSALTPNLDDMLRIMEEGPKVSAQLKKTNSKWQVELRECWPEDIIWKGTFDLNDYVEWSTNQLSSWDCQRTAWHMWEFSSKRDAEKFITLFNLKWAK